MPVLHDALRRAGIEAESMRAGFGPLRAVIDGSQFDFLYVHDYCPPELPFEEVVRFFCAGADFTINSMFLLPTGELRDPWGGQSDLREGVIRFMEDCEASRIARKKVQAIRYFRMLAWYGHGEVEPESLRVALATASDMLEVDAESAGREGIKLVSAPRPYMALSLLHRNDALKYAIGFAIEDCVLLKNLEEIERIHGTASSWRVRVAVLLLSARVPPEDALGHLATFWQLPGRAEQELRAMLDSVVAVDVGIGTNALRELARRFGSELTGELLVMRWVMEDSVGATSNQYLRVIEHMAQIQ